MDNTVKEPLIHLSKREDMSFGKKWLVRIIAILLLLSFSHLRFLLPCHHKVP